jgi:hypothetical protein
VIVLTVTYSQIATQTLGSNTTTVTFSSISGTYTDLVLVINIRSTAASNEDYSLLRFNSDTGNNYSYTYLNGSGTAATSGRSSNVSYISDVTFAAANITSGIFTPGIINIQNYSNTTTNKTTVSRGSSTTTTGQVSATAGLWRSTSAITSISLSCFQSGAQFASGSTFSLYGIKAE